MKIQNEIRKLIEVMRVANDDVIGNVARQVLNLKWKEGLSARNQAHKILDELALTKQIQKGKGFYSASRYSGSFGEHDRKITECMARLILLGYPLTVYREASFSHGRRVDLAVLIGRNRKASCALIEVVNTETEIYLRDKIQSWKVWEDANKELSQLFGTSIPYFTIVTHGSNEAMTFESFIEEAKR